MVRWSKRREVLGCKRGGGGMEVWGGGGECLVGDRGVAVYYGSPK